MRDDRSYALVLGGGGAKGAYQIGAWKAFRETGIRFHAIVGASVGALNGALVAQDDFDRAVALWRNITIDKIVDLPRGLKRRSAASFAELNRAVIRNHGLHLQPLRELLRRTVDEAGIRRSGVDFGITTYEVTAMKPLAVFLEAVPEGLLADYLLASASFPAFRPTEIQGRRFFDGGLVDNVPYRMVRGRGYRRIAVVDVSGLGVNRRANVVGTETIYVKNSIEMGGVLDFDPDFIETFMELGYLDTMKVLERLDGERYFLARDRGVEERLSALLRGSAARAGILRLLSKRAPEARAELDPSIRATLPRELRERKELVVPLLECAALSLDIDRVRRYRLAELLAEVRARRERIEATAAQERKRPGRALLRLARALFRPKESLGDALAKPPYAHYLAVEAMKAGPLRAAGRLALSRLYPFLVPARILFTLLDSRSEPRPEGSSASSQAPGTSGRSP